MWRQIDSGVRVRRDQLQSRHLIGPLLLKYSIQSKLDMIPPNQRFRGNISRTLLETFKFGFYLLTPILVMYYVGIDTDRKFNLPGFWPDPVTLNQIPKEPHEIQAEVARIRRARMEKRARLEARARELGITEEIE